VKALKMEHRCGPWDLWNLFPHNTVGIAKYLLLNLYSRLCYLDTLDAYRNKSMNMKSVEKGSTGSTLTVYGGFPINTRNTGGSRQAQFGHSEFPKDLTFATKGSSSGTCNTGSSHV
jgi:hypothetical protein